MTRGLRGAILAKMANMADTRQSLGKNSNDMAKGRFESGDLTKMANMAKFIKALTTCHIRWQRSPLKSGSVDENGEYGENDKFGENSL